MKYWVYLDGKVPGAYSPAELQRLSGFSMTTLVCQAEGEIQDKNWRYAGEFSDIAQLAKRQSGQPAPPLSAQGSLSGLKNSGEVLESAEAKIFLHVKDLMQEVGDARHSRELIVSLQSQIEGLTRDLKRGLEEKSALEKRAGILEKDGARLQKESQEKIERLEASLWERGESLSALKSDLEQARFQADKLKMQLEEALEDLTIRNSLVNRLAKDLSEKEKSLAKSLEIIERLEGELKGISSLKKTNPAPSSLVKESSAEELPLPSLESRKVSSSAAPAPILQIKKFLNR